MSRLSGAIRTVARPRWALAYWRGRRGRSAPSRPFWVDERPDAVREPAVALAEVLGTTRERCAAAMEEAWIPEHVPGDPPVWWPRGDLLRLVGALTRLLGPRSAVEVGVARGYTSAVILAVLEAQGGGRLTSIELPPRDVEPGFVGRAIPERLRERWRLVLGPSGTELTRVGTEAAPIDLFVHDGDHSYRSQREDLRTVWPHLARGAVALVDDVWTPAVFDFATDVGAEVVIASWPGLWADYEGVALLRKTA